MSYWPELDTDEDWYFSPDGYDGYSMDEYEEDTRVSWQYPCEYIKIYICPDFLLPFSEMSR